MPFNGRAFLVGIQHLDPAARARFERHGASTGGRWSFCEQLMDEAMARMADATKEGNDGE